MSAAAIYSSELRCMSTKRYCAYILISACAVTCYHIASTLAPRLISLSSILPLLVGYTIYAFRYRLRHRRSLQYCVLLSIALFSLGDAVRLIQFCTNVDPKAMTNVHLAVTHFCLAFLVLSESEYYFRGEHLMSYPDVFLAPGANVLANLYPNSVLCSHCGRRCPSDDRGPPAAVPWHAVVLDIAICMLWYAGVWRFTSLLQAWLNPNFRPEAGVAYRPFTTAYGFEVVWASRGVVGASLQAVMMRPVRILNSYIFACGADGVRWLKRSWKSADLLGM